MASNDDKLIKALEDNSKALKQCAQKMDDIMKPASTTKASNTKSSNATSGSVSSQTKILDTLSKKMKTDISTYATSMLSFGKLLDTTKKMVKTVQEVDAAMNDLYQVTHETDKRYEQFLTNSKTKAIELGVSLTDLIKQTAILAKSGLSLEESAKLAQTSILYSNISGLDNSAAVSALTAVMNAFNIEASDSITIIDKLSALAKQFGTSSGDLGTELAQAASILAGTGNSLDETLAMLTALTSITKNVSESGDALAVLSMRLHGMKEELSAFGEDTSGIETINEIQKQLLSLTEGKVNIFSGTDSSSLKSTYDILQEISAVWDNMNNTKQSELLNILTGDQDNSSIAALLSDMSEANQALNTSMHSTGSAYQEQAQWMDTLEGKLQRFQASFQSLSDTMINSDLLKFFVDLGTIVVNGADSLTNLLTPLGTLAATIGAGLGFQNVGRGKMFPLCYC